MGLKLYLDYMSQPCRAIVIFLKLHGVQFEEKIVSFVTGDTRSEWYGQINPMQRVPTLDDDGFILTESVAIMKYLIRKVGAADKWYPQDTHQMARVDEFVAWQHSGVRRHAALIFIDQAFIPHRSGKPVDEAALTQHIGELEKILNQMENYYLKNRDYLGGVKLSFADLLGICELMQAVSVGYPVDKNRPRLAEWMDRVKIELQPHFNDVHSEIMKFSSPYKKNF